MSGPKQAPYRQKMRDDMLAIANRLVATEGLGALQARRIALEAKCAVGTLYNVFGGLDYLIIEANACTLDSLGVELASANQAAAAGSVAERLLALALAYLGFANTHTKAWRAVFEHQLAANVEVPDWYRQRQGTLFALVEDILDRVDPNPVVRISNARALFSAVHGIVAISLDSKLGDFNYAEAERQVRFVVTAIATGLAKPQTS